MMPEILLGLFILWVFVTLVGHVSWVLIRTVFRLMTDQPAIEKRPSAELRDDVAAGRRLIQRLLFAQKIDQQQATDLQLLLRDLEFSPSPNSPHSLRPAPKTLGPTASPSIQQGATSEPGRLPAKTMSPPVHREPVPFEESVEPPVMGKLCDEGDAEVPVIVADIVTDLPPRPQASQADPTVPAARRVAPIKPAPPALSKAEIIQSFLAAHNIRWGELVAGMLIVICSIGLVVSLWQSIVSYRVIPSLIFLGANAAIYAAGLYTLSRWKLRHTSRAVLVIATLLVPLSVLAGLAAAGTGAEAVRLSDPFTVMSLLVAGGVYGLLLLLGGRALTGPYARQAAIAVAGPACVLPLIPAAVRNFGTGAGWFVAIGSLGVLISLTWMIKIRRRETPLAVVGSRSRILVMAFGGFAMAVTIGYLLFAVSGFETRQLAILPIAISAIPAWVGLAAAGRSLMTAARSGVQSLIGAVTGALLIGICWATLPASMLDASWLWAWAIALSGAGLLVGWMLNQPRWLPLSTLPIGIASVISSHVWMTGAAWDSVPVWNRLIGGQPMLAATLMAIGVCVAAALIRHQDRRRWMGYAAMFWIGFVTVSAGVLAIADGSLLGIAPWWSVTAILCGCVIASVYQSSRHPAWAWGTITATALACFSYARPLQLIPDLQVLAPDVWMATLLSIAFILMALREIAPRIKPLRSQVIRDSADTWSLASIAACMIASLIACLAAIGNWSTSATVLAIATAIVIWAATTLRSTMVVRIAQLGSIATAAVIGYGTFGEHLFAFAALENGHAPWAWAIVTASVTGCWFALREFARVNHPLIRRRLRFLNQRDLRAGEMIDGWTTNATVGLVSWGAAWAFAAVVTDVAKADLLSNQTGSMLPVVAMGAAAGAVLWQLRLPFQQNANGSSSLLVTLVMTVIVWLSTYLASLPADMDAMSRLVMATTFTVAGCLAWTAARSKVAAWLRMELRDEIVFGVAGVSVLVSSMVLLKLGWLDLILQDELAMPTATSAVASWCLVGSMSTLWAAKRKGNHTLSFVSAALAPIAIVLIVPAIRVVHPIVWAQCAALASLGWIAITRVWFRGNDWPVVRGAARHSALLATALGVATAACVSLRVLFDLTSLEVFCGAAGLVLSGVTIALWSFGQLPMSVLRSDDLRDPPPRLGWPVALTLLAGQAAWWLELSGLISGSVLAGSERYFTPRVNLEASEVLLTIWCIGAVVSLLRFRFLHALVDFWHAASLSVALMMFGIFMGQWGSSWMPWVGLVATFCGGLLASCVAMVPTTRLPQWFSGRFLGWCTIGLGLLVIDQLGSGHPWPVKWTVIVTWIGSWVVGWRLLNPDRKEKWAVSEKAIPDSEFSGLLMLAAVGEMVFLIGGSHPQVLGMIDGLLAVRLASYLAAAFSTYLRGGRRLVWPIAIGCLIAVAALLAIRVGMAYEASVAQRAMLASLTASFSIALLAHLLPGLARIANLVRVVIEDSVMVSVGRLIRGMFPVAIAVSAMTVVLAAAMIADAVTPEIIQLTILSVALVAWGIAELAELSRSDRVRHAAVSLALISIGLFASVDSGESLHPLLAATMRWLVASVFTTGMILFGVPRVLGKPVLSRWQSVLRTGSMISAAAAGISLVAMLIIETTLHTPEGILGVSLPMAIGVAVTLSVLSLMAGLVAVLSGSPTMADRIVTLSDTQRRVLIVVSQAIAAITWLHLFLCKTDWAFIGMRGYWPYIVMAIAFVSVGVTEWARRRGDQVLSETLSQTSLYLPLVPVIGFWLSGAWAELSWLYVGEKVRYDLLLALGAVYYVGLSAMWQQIWPRVAAIVLGNAALWVVLVQLPGWSFLSHPQAWLIPPAICVLAATHLYRERLPRTITTTIRYASTLVIYISSTADMLLQQIGQNISGPIILVLLALAGMLAGVLLRVRPFLYLGATFVFLGATSMVWHAQVSIDAVWPWWVFGITTGILLLAGLMALEKNKDKLRHYANTLATWQG